MPDSPLEFWLSFVFLAFVCVGICRFSRWCYWLAAPFSVLMLYRGWSFLYANDDFSGTLLSTFGLGYWLQFAASYALPVVCLVGYGVYDFRCRSNGLRPA